MLKFHRNNANSSQWLVLDFPRTVLKKMSLQGLNSCVKSGLVLLTLLLFRDFFQGKGFQELHYNFKLFSDVLLGIRKKKLLQEIAQSA